MTEETRFYPRSSAFEALLAKVYIEIWELQGNPNEYVNRIHEFVNVHLPTMFQEKLREKLPDFQDKLDESKRRISAIGIRTRDSDPFEQDTAQTHEIPAEEMELAGMVWHAAIDVLTEAGFNFPISKATPRRRMVA